MAVIAVHASLVSAIPQYRYPVPCICPWRSKPVCGTDGNTYRSECKLYCENYQNSNDIRVAHDGPCPEKVTIINPTHTCSCAEDSNVVCASDGNTYANACELNCATATNPRLRLEHYGQCKDSVKEAEGCFCPSDYNPVCGNDGNTYPNLCSLLCQRTSNSDINIANEGACSQTVTTTCSCPKELIEVCGSDGITYNNPCELNCATAKNSMLRLSYFGKCDHGGVNVVENVPCVCTADYKPVCGTDGKTYPNKCSMLCQRGANPSIEVGSEGPCPSAVNVVSCTCEEQKVPVCGSDGNTYKNPCLLNCATITNPMLRIAQFGKCDDGVKVEEPIVPSGCSCPRDLAPVCASDGKTYNNECLMRCAGAHVSFIRSGRCDPDHNIDIRLN